MVLPHAQPGHRPAVPPDGNAYGPGHDSGRRSPAAGITPLLARVHLAELAHAHMVTEHEPGRYSFHGILRAYADELVHREDTEHDRWLARERLAPLRRETRSRVHHCS